MNCIDCNNDLIIDYNKTITLKGENYYLGVCSKCGKRHFILNDSIDYIKINFIINDSTDEFKMNFEVK